MSFCADFDDIITRGFPLGKLSTWGIGGPAEMLARPRSPRELARLLARAAEEARPVRFLGGASNLLLADEGVKGLVVKLEGKAFARVEAVPGGLRCGAGAKLARAVREAAAAGLSGLEGLAGIPGTIGGALVMNAGGRWGCIGEAVADVRILDASGAPAALPRAQAGFGYRTSRLRGRPVTGGLLVLTPDDPEAVRARTRKVLAEKRRTQPLRAASAGCVFRNPPGLSAGLLIEELGFKGRRVGGAAVSERHANFILNLGGARCADVLELIDAIRRAAREARGIELDLEVEVWS